MARFFDSARAKTRSLHAVSASLLAGFLLLHLGNHLAGLAGQNVHLRYMAAVRPFYRNAVVEPLLLVLLGWQAASGIFMVLRGWRGRRGMVAWIQVASGLYLALFVVIHVAAVLNGRASGLDTNVHFAAAGFQVAPWPWFFAPYYALAVLAVFTHVGCALYWHVGAAHRRAALATTVGAGAVAAGLITASLAGLLHPVAIPPRYLAPYRATAGGSPAPKTASAIAVEADRATLGVIHRKAIGQNQDRLVPPVAEGRSNKRLAGAAPRP